MPKRRTEDEERKDIMPLPNGADMLLGVIQQFLGYDRARVICEDGKIRLCRIPGRYKKRVWMKVGDVVLVAPWEFQRDEKGDIIYRYSGSEVQKLESMRLTEGLKKALEGFSA